MARSLGLAFGLVAAATLLVPGPAESRLPRENRDYAQSRDRYGEPQRARDGNDRRAAEPYRERRESYRCDPGTTGTLVGAIAGGLLGNAAVGRHGSHAAGALGGAGIGALVGTAIDRDC